MTRLAIFLALIQLTNAFISPTIPNFLPYLPRSLGNWMGSEPETRIPDTNQQDIDYSENPLDEIWELSILPPSVWSNLLTSVRTEAPKAKEIREDSYPVMMSRFQVQKFGNITKERTFRLGNGFKLAFLTPMLTSGNNLGISMT